jgi:hypothetical protein
MCVDLNRERRLPRVNLAVRERDEPRFADPHRVTPGRELGEDVSARLVGFGAASAADVFAL